MSRDRMNRTRPLLGEVKRQVDAGTFGEVEALFSDNGLFLFGKNDMNAVSCSWEHIYSYL